MEGLIPMVFKAIKKNKVRRQYECLSSGTPAQSYNIDDFYVNGENPLYFTHSTEKVQDSYSQHNHRRHKSVGDFYVNDRAIYGRGGGGGSVSPPHVPKQLVRFRSHRMFSCVTGA